MLTVWRLITGLCLLGTTVVAPGLLLAQALAPELPRAGRLALGLTTGLLVVPTLAFGLAMLLGTHLHWPLLAGAASLLAAPSLLVLQRRRARPPPRPEGTPG